MRFFLQRAPKPCKINFRKTNPVSHFRELGANLQHVLLRAAAQQVAAQEFREYGIWHRLQVPAQASHSAPLKPALRQRHLLDKSEVFCILVSALILAE